MNDTHDTSRLERHKRRRRRRRESDEDENPPDPPNKEQGFRKTSLQESRAGNTEASQQASLREQVDADDERRDGHFEAK